jgi:hypothetical protein
MLAKHAVALTIALLVLSTSALAQKADVSFVIGGSFVSDSNVNVLVLCPGPICPTNSGTLHNNHQVFLEGTPAVRLVNLKIASLHLEVPIAGIPSQSLHVTSNLSSLNAGSLSSTFITPALRLKLLPGSPIAPFISFGGGWAHYSLSNGSTSKGAIEYGGGLDFKIGIPHIGLRAEVRDFVTGDPNFAFAVPGIVSNNQSGLNRNNVLAGGGIVFRF